MKATIPIRTLRDHSGNILEREYEEIELTPEQIDVFCKLVVKLIKQTDLKEVG